MTNRTSRGYLHPTGQFEPAPAYRGVVPLPDGSKLRIAVWHREIQGTISLALEMEVATRASRAREGKT